MHCTKSIILGDLWGPFLLTFLLSVTLSLRTTESASTIITSIFVIMWVGGIVVYLNANFLGSHMSIFQSICLLGYCVFPINVVSLATWLIGKWIPPALKLTLVAVSFIWATLCKYWFIEGSISFVGEMVPQRKRKLALYPICLFYLFLSWFVLIVWWILIKCKEIPLNISYQPITKNIEYYSQYQLISLLLRRRHSCLTAYWRKTSSEKNALNIDF